MSATREQQHIASKVLERFNREPRHEVLGASFGKWSQAGVPHRGWTCIGVDDLEEPDHICEMCEHAEVRYVHVMTHPDYEGELLVGSKSELARHLGATVEQVPEAPDQAPASEVEAA